MQRLRRQRGSSQRGSTRGRRCRRTSRGRGSSRRRRLRCWLGCRSACACGGAGCCWAAGIYLHDICRWLLMGILCLAGSGCSAWPSRSCRRAEGRDEATLQVKPVHVSSRWRLTQLHWRRSALEQGRCRRQRAGRGRCRRWSARCPIGRVGGWPWVHRAAGQAGDSVWKHPELVGPQPSFSAGRPLGAACRSTTSAINLTDHMHASPRCGMLPTRRSTPSFACAASCGRCGPVKTTSKCCKCRNWDDRGCRHIWLHPCDAGGGPTWAGPVAPPQF